MLVFTVSFNINWVVLSQAVSGWMWWLQNRIRFWKKRWVRSFLIFCYLRYCLVVLGYLLCSSCVGFAQTDDVL